MELRLLDAVSLADLPSGSGIEWMDGHYYICSDDSPVLYKVDAGGTTVDQINIFNWAFDGRIPKVFKPDFEAMVNVGCEIWVFGSGSLAPRDVFVKVDLTTKAIRTFSLTIFYDALCRHAAIQKEQLNIEGAAVHGEQLLLLNRGNNCIYRFALADFTSCVEQDGVFPNIVVQRYNLPFIDGCVAGFSGATVFGDDLIFCASLEKTKDWINDGEILGSFIGLIHLCENSEEIADCVQLMQGNEVFLGKIEGLCVTEKSEKQVMLSAICDNDDGRSTLLTIEMSL